MPHAHLTDIVVSRLKKPGTYFDETTPAFAIRVGKNRKTWFVIQGRERLRTNIGQYPQISLADARKAAKKLLTEEPIQHSRMRFEAAYDLYKTAIASKKPRTQHDYKRLIEKYLLPTFAKKRLSDVTYEDVTAITDGLRSSEGGHALAIARTFFRWCVRPPRRYIPHSPLEGVQISLGKPRARVLQDPELVQVWRAAEKQGCPHGTIVQLLILTGQRRGEIASLRWPWINQKKLTITLPAEVCKNGIEHTFPFNGRVSQILETIPRLNSTDLLFPSRISDERPISGWSKFKHELDDGVEGWTLHDLRRTFATSLASLGVGIHVTERLLNHISGSTTGGLIGIYQRHEYEAEKRAAIEKWEARIAELLART